MRSSLRPLRVLPVAVALAASYGPADAQTDGGSALAMTRLELTLDLDYDEGSLAGTASYELSNLSAVAVTEIPFNVGRLLTVRTARGPSGSLTLTQDVAVFEDSPKRQVNHVVVTLSRPLAPGGTTRVELGYGGYLVGYTETGSIYIKDRVAPDFSILREDAFAWPSVGTLSRRANRVAPRPDFTFAARITVPEGQTVASGGRLVERTTREGRTTFTYESVAPVPFVNLPIAPYALLSDAGVRVYYFPEDSVGARQVLRSATRGLDLLGRWFGPLGTTPDLAVMEIPEVWGSQASLTGGIIQTADAFRDPGRMTALYHELSHLWNAPDTDQPSARWNEGLATFLAERMAAELDGRDKLAENVARTGSRLLSSAEDNPGLAEVPFLRYGEAGATDLSYRVGFLMFYALFETLGADRFDAALGGYYQSHRERGGTFPELLERIQSESPRDLSAFFDTWVRTTRWLDELRAGKPVERIGR
jgi:hypothetical protein